MSKADTPIEYLQLILALAEPYMNRAGAGLDEDWQEFISVVQKTEISFRKELEQEKLKAKIDEIKRYRETITFANIAPSVYAAERIQTLLSEGE
jgi:hypothetical protein